MTALSIAREGDAGVRIRPKSANAAGKGNLAVAACSPERGDQSCSAPFKIQQRRLADQPYLQVVAGILAAAASFAGPLAAAIPILDRKI